MAENIKLVVFGAENENENEFRSAFTPRDISYETVW